MPRSNDDSERIRERSEEDMIIEPRPASNEFESSNQPHRDLAEGLPATLQPSDRRCIQSAETESDQPRQGSVPSLPEAPNQHPKPSAEPEPNATSRKTLFGLKRQVKEQSVPRHFNRFDYEQKYPRDPFGEERAENARVWFTYLDEAESYDRDKVDGWKDTVDVLLVFAGLFSGVVTTFLSQTSQNLQQNFTQVSASLLYEIAQLHRAQLTGASIADVPSSPLTPDSSFTPSTNASVVNGLWLTSLGISLCTALFAVLTKQWLFYYQSPVSGTARDKVMLRQFRFEGLRKWRFAVIIDLLPILLHLALGLFLIGLVVFILPLDARIVWIIIVLSGFTYILYLVSIILPIRYPECPYVTPLTIYVDFFIQLFSLLFQYIHFRLPSIHSWLPSDHIGLTRLSIYQDRLFSERSFHLTGSTISNAATRVWIFLKANITIPKTLRVPSSRNQREARVSDSINSAAAMLQHKALEWLRSTSSNPAVSRIVARSVFKSPYFDVQSDFYFQLSLKVHNPRFDDDWDEGSLRPILDDSEFFEDLYHYIHLRALGNLYMLHRYPKIVSFIKKELSMSLREEFKERFPELFNIISILHKDPEEVLLTGLQDNTLKLRLDVWLHLLREAPEDKDLASQIINSRAFDLFNWHESERPSVQTYLTEAIPLTKQQLHRPGDSSNPGLNRPVFSYLFRYFVRKHFPDDGSFESRYLLFIAIYQNLISNEPLIVGPTLATFKYLLNTFSHLVYFKHECIQGRVITATFINRMQRDMLMHDFFFNDNMSLDLQKAAILCFERFWSHQMETTGDFSPFFTPQKEGLQFIYRWCSKGEWEGALLVQQLFMPGNLSNLRMLLLEDRDHAESNLRNCLQHLLLSSNSTTCHKHKMLYEEHIILNVIHLFTSTTLSDGSDPLFSVLCDPSVLAQAWALLVTYPWYLYNDARCPIVDIDRSRVVLALLPSRLDLESLRKVYDFMIQHIENLYIGGLVDYKDSEDSQDPIAMRRACISAYTFGRMAGLITDPNTFNLSSRITNDWVFKRSFKNVTSMQNELERQYMEEKRRLAHPLLFQFTRINRTFRNSLWKKRPEVQQVEMELDAVTQV